MAKGFRKFDKTKRKKMWRRRTWSTSNEQVENVMDL
jgi:hypothetical protein